MSNNNSRFSDRFVFLNDLLKLIIAMLLVVAIISLFLIFYISSIGGGEAEAVAEGATTTDAAAAEPAAEPTTEPAAEEAAPAESVAPSLDALAATEVEAGETVNLSGSGTPGDELEIVANGEVIATATVGEDGTWSTSASLAEAGDYELQVNSLAEAGGSSAPAALTVLAAAPALAMPSLTLPDLSGLSSGEEVALSGTGEPGSELEIVANGEVIGTATVGDDGSWSFPWPFSEPGDYDLQVRTLDGEGNVVNETEPVGLSFSLPELALPTLTLPDLSGLFGGGEAPPLSGTGTPGDEVEIVANGEVIGTATVDADGTWSFPWPFSEPGDYELQLRTTGTDGSEVTTEPLSLSIPAPEIAVPTLDLPDVGDLGAGDEVEFSGTGTPGSEVEIVANGEVIGTATVDAEGNWTFPFSFAEAGDYDLSVRALDAEGNVVAESDSVANVAVAAATAAVTFDDLASDEVEAGTEVELSGTGEPGSEIEIVANGEVIGTATIDEDGTWTFATSFDEADEVELEVRSLDADGNGVASAGPLSLTVTEAAAETTAEAIAAPTLEPLTVTDFGTDETISLTGTGEPSGEVEVVADGRVFGVAPVDVDGTWRFAIAFSDPGTYDVFVRGLDADGNVVEESDSEAATVTVAAPPASERFAFIFPAAGADIIVGRLTLIGTADPGQEIEVLDGETLLGTTETAANGEWAFSTEPALGSHAFSARLVDGGQSLDPRAVEVVNAADVDCETNLGISRGDNYIVGTCNTFGTVIERTGSTLQSLIAANPQIANPDLIYPGDILNIP